jgi:hypothetical protein
VARVSRFRPICCPRKCVELVVEEGADSDSAQPPLRERSGDEQPSPGPMSVDLRRDARGNAPAPDRTTPPLELGDPPVPCRRNGRLAPHTCRGPAHVWWPDAHDRRDAGR